MAFDFDVGSVLLIDKPYQWTSFDVVNKVRCLIKHHKHIKKIKIGHAGTLDPLATGLLILCTGSYTKKIDEYQGMEKEYTGTFVLGATRPSYDKETEIDNTFDISTITEDQIYQVAKTFVGNSNQVPPQFSAKKINGERAYESARKGINLKIEPKPIFIREFEITKIELPFVYFRTLCSKGTYIRSLANDFGIKLQNGAYLDTLRRTSIGNYHVNDAFSMETIEKLIAQ